ncbi:MAG: peptidoglycan-binding protein [Clostridiaceae bacterium]|nr:peptidoglycan-binding protein [Clostridiaceae bacterium]
MKRRVRIFLVCLMACAMLFQNLPHEISATTNPTAAGLTEFAFKALNENWGYVYGTYGQTITQALIDGKRNQYPSVYAEIMSDGQTAYVNAADWIGHRGADCVGLIKAYLWWQSDSLNPKYNADQDRSANGMYNAATVKGPISTLPNIHGALVCRDGHIGVYIGNGEVIESRGVEYGVVKTKLSDRHWTSWCLCPYIAYPTTGWVTVQDQQYYYRDGQYVTGMQSIDGKVWLFGPDGARLTGFQTTGGQLRYFSGSGLVLTGWQMIDGSRYYLNADSVPQTGWQTIDSKQYLFGETGILLTGWQQNDDKLYYLDENGNPAYGAATVDGRALVFSAGGALLTGWQQTSDSGVWRDLSGQALSGAQLIGGGAYLLDAGGSRLTGWQDTGGKSVYYDPATGVRAAAGLQLIDTAGRLISSDGSLAAAGQWVYSESGLYLGASAGVPVKGSQALAASADAGLSTQNITLNFDTETALLQMVNQNAFTVAGGPLILQMPPAAPASTTTALTLSGAAPAEPVWLSLDPAVAAVDQTGQVTAAGVGRTIIAVVDGAGSYALTTVTVLPDMAGLTLTAAGITLEPGMSAEPPVSGLPADLADACQWSSSDPSVVEVTANGRQTALQCGTATVGLSLGKVPLLSWTVTAKKPLLGLSAAQTALILPVGGEKAGLFSLMPANGTQQDLTLTSSDESVAVWENGGVIKAKSVGATTLTAQSGGYSVSCQLTVSGLFPVLKNGSSGETVRTLQQNLTDLGYLCGPVDGQFGPLTEFAVTALQQRLQQSLTGTAGHALQVMLLDGLASPAAGLQQAGRLSAGDSGEQVFVLQKRLYELNFLKSSVDGQYGPLTVQAVTTLQALNNLPQNGVAAADELALLFKPQVIAGQATLSLGDSGYEVLLLQQRLKNLNYYSGDPDSTFSTAVEQAVRDFQSRAGLEVDGHAGIKTQTRLYAADAPAAIPPAAPAAPAPSPAPAVSAPPSAVQVSAPAFTKAVRRGSTGPVVRLVQQRLIELGFLSGSADGKFGPATKKAALAFQRSAGLKVDGIVGRQTYNALFQGAVSAAPAAGSSQPAPAASSGSVPTQTVRRGSQGTAVRLVQQRLIDLGFLRGSADGKFGPATQSAVKAFQKSRGLKADGVAGPLTRSKLFA